MKKLFISVLFAVSLVEARAQLDSIIRPATAQDQRYVHALQLELPQLELKYSIPIKEKGIGNLPFGMNQYFGSPNPGISAIGLNYTFRPLSLFYKDKIGLSFYYNGFGAYLDGSGFNRYMAAKYSSQYNYTPYAYFTTLMFYGPAIGIAYRLHYGSYVIEPNLIFGFERFDEGTLDLGAGMRQYGSNQFVDYELGVTNATPFQHSFRGRLQLGRRYHVKKSFTVFELGLVADYIYSPHAYNITITQTSYGYLPTVERLVVKTVYRQVNFGLYLKAYLHRRPK